MGTNKSLQKGKNIAQCLLDRFDDYIINNKLSYIKNYGTNDIKNIVLDVCTGCDHCDLRSIPTKRFVILSILISNSIVLMRQIGNKQAVKSLESVNTQIMKFILSSLNKED